MRAFFINSSKNRDLWKIKLSTPYKVTNYINPILTNDKELLLNLETLYLNVWKMYHLFSFMKLLVPI